MVLVVACSGGEYEYAGCEAELLVLCCSGIDRIVLEGDPTELYLGVGYTKADVGAVDALPPSVCSGRLCLVALVVDVVTELVADGMLE